jgi:endothelin-converting enzyme
MPTDVILQHSSFSPAKLIRSLSSADQDNFNKLKAAYDACMDEDTIKKRGLEPLMGILHHVAEIFPLTESALNERALSEDAEGEGLANTIGYLAKLGVSALISCGAGADDKDPDVVVVQASPPYEIGLPAKDYYKDDKVVKLYEATLAQIFDKFHPSSNDEDAALKFGGLEIIAARGKSNEYAHKVVELEKKLAAASPDAEDRDDVTVSNFVHSEETVMLKQSLEILQPFVSL